MQVPSDVLICITVSTSFTFTMTKCCAVLNMQWFKTSCEASVLPSTPNMFLLASEVAHNSDEQRRLVRVGRLQHTDPG